MYIYNSIQKCQTIPLNSMIFRIIYDMWTIFDIYKRIYIYVLYHGGWVFPDNRNFCSKPYNLYYIPINNIIITRLSLSPMMRIRPRGGNQNQFCSFCFGFNYQN